MKKRSFGTTGLRVSELGMGCNRLGEPGMLDAHWVALVHRAIDLGVNLFDTSESYQWGDSEEVLGRAIGNNPDVYVATKVSRVRETNEKDFSADRVIERAEQSLKRLRRECIDIFQLHSPSLENMQQYDWPEAMTRLKQQGKIRVAAVSINDAESALWLIENDLVEALQVPFNIIEHQVGHEIFPIAAEAGVGTMIRMPMAQGILTGKFSPVSQVDKGHRALMAGKKMMPYIERAAELGPLAEECGMPLAILALKYAISPHGVSTAIPGARSFEQLEQNVAASDGKELTEAIVNRIEVMQAGWEA